MDDRHIVVQSQIDCTGIVLLGFAVAQTVGMVSAAGRALVVDKVQALASRFNVSRPVCRPSGLPHA